MTPKPSTPSIAKRTVTYAIAAEMYSVSVDVLREIPEDKVKRLRLGHRTVLMRVVELDAYFDELFDRSA